ncbi:hypothetical protein [Streptomyces candidus]|uniref:Uncharacterized protein n=1 Tax=Streptomyces candidus TaxID=67283 RepID=A0A7X0HKV1_9ACTN|nr:hypothetical protein [Streptomyces candidus]MBB6439370.1 hypothetical protein [Streptomyces candidus]GHH55010.1 hypothetical protein GCM10018773_58870 [Streptomyces candidus]
MSVNRDSRPTHYRTADGRRTAEVTETTITVFEGLKIIAVVPATEHHHEYPGSVWKVIREAVATPTPTVAEPTATVSTRHPDSGLVTSYRVTVETVERVEMIDGEGVAVGLAARLTIQASPWQRPVTILASRLVNEKDWWVDSKREHGGRVLSFRGFGNRRWNPRRLMADVGEVLSLCAYEIPGLVEDAEPGSPLVLGKVKSKRKAKAATGA